jgi:hypothetical protein
MTALHSCIRFLRNNERLRENWARLDKGRGGKVIRRTGDFAVRKGQCLEPTAVVEMFPFTVTHKVIIQSIK